MRNYVLGATTVICAVGFANGAQAEEQALAPAQVDQASADAASQASAGLQDIIVTARRRSENLQDVPIAITALGGDTLSRNGVFETQDLAGAVPSLQISSPYGTAQPNFTLRGIGVANEYNSNAASPIGVYVDEVYQGFRASHGQQLYDLQQVEVLRGPQGTLYGRNTTGGAINFITNKPDLAKHGGYITAGYGNFNRVNAEGALNLVVVPDTVALRVAGIYNNSEPQVRNLSGRNPGGDENYGLRGSLGVSKGDFRLTVKGYIAKSTGGTAAVFPTNASPSGEGPIVLGPLGAAFGLSYDRSDLNDHTVENDGIGLSRIKASGVTMNAQVDLTDKLLLTSLTGYDTSSFFQQPTDCDGTPISICRQGYSSKFEGFNQELRLNFETGRLKLVGGLYYGWDQINAHTELGFFGVLSGIRESLGLPPTYFNPGGMLDPTGLPTQIIGTLEYSQTRSSKAIFGEGVYEFSRALSLTVGLRYTKDKAAYGDGLSVLNDDTGTPRLVLVSASNTPLPYSDGLPRLERRGGSNALTGRGILSYKPNDDIMGYASYSRGYRAGTFNGLAYVNPAQVFFVPPEKVDAYELGLKVEALDRRLRINTSLFYNKYVGQQAQEVRPDTTSILRSVDGTIKGAELEILFAATPELLLSASGSRLKTEYKKGQLLSGIDIGGNPFPFAPKWSLNAAADYTVVNTSDMKVILHGDVNYLGDYSYDLFADRQSTGPFRNGQKGYALLNASVNVERGSVSLNAWIKNIADKTYYPYALNIEESFGLDYFIRGGRRTYGMDLTYKF